MPSHTAPATPHPPSSLHLDLPLDLVCVCIRRCKGSPTASPTSSGSPTPKRWPPRPSSTPPRWPTTAAALNPPSSPPKWWGHLRAGETSHCKVIPPSCCAGPGGGGQQPQHQGGPRARCAFPARAPRRDHIDLGAARSPRSWLGAARCSAGVSGAIGPARSAGGYGSLRGQPGIAARQRRDHLGAHCGRQPGEAGVYPRRPPLFYVNGLLFSRWAGAHQLGHFRRRRQRQRQRRRGFARPVTVGEPSLCPFFLASNAQRPRAERLALGRALAAADSSLKAQVDANKATLETLVTSLTTVGRRPGLAPTAAVPVLANQECPGGAGRPSTTSTSSPWTVWTPSPSKWRTSAR